MVAAADLDPDNASILVCGGGGVALHVTRKLKDMGSWVWMLQRKEDRRKEIEGMMAIVAKGDALSKDDVDKVFAGEGGGRGEVGAGKGLLRAAGGAEAAGSRRAAGLGLLSRTGRALVCSCIKINGSRHRTSVH